MQPTANDPFPIWVRAMNDRNLTECPNCGYNLTRKELEFDNVDTYTVADIFESIAKYIEAGRILKDGGYMDCCSVCEAWNEIAAKLFEDDGGDDDDKDKAFGIFQQYFQPDNATHYWWGDPSRNTEEEHNARIMACLLMAYMLRQDDVTDDNDK